MKKCILSFAQVISEKLQAEKAESLGIKAIVMKPLLIQDLAKTVREVLDG